MNRSPITKKALFLSLLISICIISAQILQTIFNTSTKIVFCDVGQGDGTYIRIHNRFDVVIDAGPDRKILKCLGKYMPFYDRTIELGFISHDQKDHFGGFDYLLDRYTIKKMFLPDLKTSLQSFNRLRQKMREKKTSLQTISAGSKIKMANDLFVFYWPRGHCIASDNNDCSLIFTFEENNLKILFTGDASARVLNNLIDSRWSLSRFNRGGNDIGKINILKVPHHGSKNGLTEKFLRLAEPVVAVISVGKKNSYGHPSKEILDLLKAKKIKIKRTDEEGDIVFKIPNSKL